jgi:FkbM family methyltransferase
MNIVEADVRGVQFRLVGYTRALELCARMNREMEVLDFIDEMAPGEVLYDLGACEGRFALYAALRGVRVYAFEPEALNHQALNENIALNADCLADRLVPLRFAVGETMMTGALKIAQPWAGGHQRVLTGAGRVDLDFDFTDEQPVQVVALDQLIAAEGLPQPHYLKIDIDGSEIPFMKGAKSTLRAPALKAVMFELQTEDGDFAEVVSQLAEAGLKEVSRHEIHPNLFNIWFARGAA